MFAKWIAFLSSFDSMPTGRYEVSYLGWKQISYCIRHVHVVASEGCFRIFDAFFIIVRCRKINHDVCQMSYEMIMNQIFESFRDHRVVYPLESWNQIVAMQNYIKYVWSSDAYHAVKLSYFFSIRSHFKWSLCAICIAWTISFVRSYIGLSPSQYDRHWADWTYLKCRQTKW